jgi:hypothetical protein
MTWDGRPNPRVQRWKTLGRYGLAIAAGGAFAALSWNPPESRPDAENTGEQPPALDTAERRNAVTEDSAPPQLSNNPAESQQEDQWALSRTRHGSSQRGDGQAEADSTPQDHPQGAVHSNQCERITTMDHAVPHTRGPP